MSDPTLDHLPPRPGSLEPAVRPAVPGYQLGALLGLGGAATVWSGVRDRDGVPVAVKVPARATAVPSLELAALRGLDHPHVVPLLDEVALADGRLALVLQLVDGGSLARVVAARGHLTPGETATVLVTLAGAMSDLHRLGLHHGDLSPANVLFQRDGRPMLSDLGLAGICGADPDAAPETVGGTAGFADPALAGGSPAGPAADVYSLGALGWLCLVGAPPEHPAIRPPLDQVCPGLPASLVAVVEGALHPDPAARPAADELARAAYDGVRPEPVRLAGGRDPAGDLTHRIRVLARAEPAVDPVRRAGRSRRRLLTLALGLVAAGGAAALLILPGLPSLAARGVADPPTSAPTARVTPVTASRATPAAKGSTVATAPTGNPLAAVVAGLARARARCFADGSSTGLAQVDRPGSPAWQADQVALGRLAAAGERYRGLRIDTSRVSPAGPSARPSTSIELTAWVATSAYDVVDGSGRLRASMPATAPVLVRLRLTRTAQGWRVESVG